MNPTTKSNIGKAVVVGLDLKKRDHVLAIHPHPKISQELISNSYSIVILEEQAELFSNASVNGNKQLLQGSLQDLYFLSKQRPALLERINKIYFGEQPKDSDSLKQVLGIMSLQAITYFEHDPKIKLGNLGYISQPQLESKSLELYDNQKLAIFKRTQWGKP